MTTVRIEVLAGAVGDAVVRRVVGAAAAQAGLSVERMQDVDLVVDELMAGVVDERVVCEITPLPDGLRVAIGPITASGDDVSAGGSGALMGLVLHAIGSPVTVTGQAGHRLAAFVISARDA